MNSLQNLSGQLFINI